ncbi:unnamed protein product, partial [marine sediment metagenome]
MLNSALDLAKEYKIDVSEFTTKKDDTPKQSVLDQVLA